MESYAFLTILIGALLIAAVSKRIEGTIITLPMLYTLFGLLIALIFSDIIELNFDNPAVEIIAELTLVLVLATDSSRIKLKNLRKYHDLPIRMLLLALPLTFILGTLVGAILFRQINIWLLAILAVTLAPIDPSLAESSVENRAVPARIRQALNIEAGVDDGVTLPFLFLFLSLAVSSEAGLGESTFIGSTVLHIAFGILVGSVMGYLGSRYIIWGKNSGWMSSQFQKIGWLALVLLTYGMAESLGGNGLIAAFIFGVISGNTIERVESESLHRYAEVENTSLMMLTFMFYGAVMLYPALQQINMTVVVYALLSLTVVRMLPVMISLIGTNLLLESKLYLGWFGPVGIASILYVYNILEAENLNGQDTVFTVVMVTIFLSVLVHGISAAPLANWYAKRIQQLQKKDLAQAETQYAPEMAMRKSSLSLSSFSPGAANSVNDELAVGGSNK
jgi:NhaP-type Na+/H+ or K+/H+ antiporter